MPSFARLPVAPLILPEQPRTKFDDEEIGRLGESIKEHGQIQAIVVAPDRKTVLVGACRVRGLLAAGVEFVEAKILDAMPSDFDLLVMQTVENGQRHRLRPWDEFVAASTMLTMRQGMTAKELAGMLKYTPANMVRILAAAKLVREAQDALKAGLIGRSDAYSISKAKTPARQRELLALRLAGASRDQLEKIGLEVRAPAKPGRPKLMRFNVPLGGGGGLIISGQKLCLEAVKNTTVELLKMVNAAITGGHDLKSFEVFLRNKNKKGSVAT